MRKWILALCLLMLLLFSVFAGDENSASNLDDEFLTEILVSDIPVTYGDEAFRARILERTEGKRDPIGLVLTGGSARACAHIGVLRYLDEQGIEPDFIVSNSMGSIIGMLYAAGISPAQMEDIMLAGDISSYFTLTLPSHGGFLDAAGFRALIDSVVGVDYRLEDTRIPCMVVCDDLISKREVRITEGRFTDILVGSFALPIYFPPMEYNGHLLIDGGVISLAPLSVAYDYSDTVIASTSFYDPVDMNLINPVTILNVSFDIGKRQNASKDLRKYYDNLIWIRCGVENFSFMAFDKAAEMAAIGYDSAALMKEQLGTLYKSGTGVDADDEAVSKRIRDLKNNLESFGHIKVYKPSSMLGFNFTVLDSESTTYYLKNSMVMGLEYKYLVNNFDMSVVAGFGADTQNLRENNSFMTAGAQFSYFPIHNIRIKLEAYEDFLRKDAGFRLLSYARQSFDMHIISNDSMKLSAHEILEYQYDDSGLLGKGSVLSVYADGRYMADQFTLNYQLGYLMTGHGLSFQEQKNYVQTDVGGEFRFNSSLFVSLSSRFRISVDGQGSVPLFISDGFVSSCMNYGSTGLYTDSTLFNSINNIGFGYRLGISPTFGEFLIVENPEFGLYASGLFAKERYAFSAGVSMNATASLIGLIKLPLTLKIGYEYHEPEFHGITASLAFSSTY